MVLLFSMDIIKEEVRGAFFEMSPFKAPAPDGFHAGFYEKAWSIIRDDISDMVKLRNLQEHVTFGKE